MKQKEEMGDLDIQGKSKDIKNSIMQSLVSVIIVTFLLFSCSGVKNVVEQENNEKEVSVDEETLILEEQKEKEFEFLFVEAIKEKVLGNSQKAIQHLSGCLEINPNSSAAMYELANIHAANNDFTSASLLLEKAISINPENKWYKSFLAQIYQQTKQYGEAAELYEELLRNDPENLEYMFMTANMLASAGRTGEAVDVYNRMESKTGINEQISLAKQQLYISAGEIENAYKEAEKLIEVNPEEPKYYGLMADLYQSQGDTVNALKYYRKIQEIDPGNGFVHFSLANHYLEKGQPEKSFEETRLGFKSDEIDLQSKLQLFMMMTGPSETAITTEQEEELINILLKEHPGESLVYALKAENLLKNNKPEEGREALLKSLENGKNDYVLWERLLFIDNDLQDWNKLYEHSRQAMDLFPNQPQIYFLNAIASFQLEKYDETISVTDEGTLYVVDNDRLKGQFLMMKGEAFYKTGKVQEAFELFDKSVELDPDNYIALNNYAYYLSLAGKNLDKAERMSGRVIERFPENATYLDTYAWILFKKGEYSLAKFYMESAIKYDQEGSPTLFEHYGDILFKLDLTDEALKYWEQAKEMGENSKILERKIIEKSYFEEDN
ncbi:MAG: tetratricopeptide repeat protein [Prolixibacteraceae bacterium]|nr:tetratricopeptide repeat protein [Prolixibacteraceae bacterium]